ncbi:MAG: efflux RND transporter periplasmic adaptor subunit [Planctomycetota bacterium]
MQLRRVLWQVIPSVAAVVGLVAALAVVGVTSAPADLPEEDVAPLPVVTAPAVWQTRIETPVRYLGEVRARQRVGLSFEVAGTISRIAVDEGNRVAEGSPIAELDVARLKADLMRLEASAEAVASDLDLARLTLRRVERSFGADAANEQEFDRASSSVTTLEARLAEARAAVERTKVDIAKSSIVSPFDAIVARRHADTGSLAQPGTAVVTLVERVEPEVRIGVAPAAVPSIGTEIGVAVRGATYQATVTEVLPEIDRITRTAEVRLALDAQLGDGLRDGDAASIEIPSVAEIQGVWVPLSALAQSVRGLWALYIAAPDEEDGWVVQRREVEMLRPESGRAYVRGAIEPGELIVIDGKQRLVPGLAVTPRSAETLSRAEASP